MKLRGLNTIILLLTVLLMAGCEADEAIQKQENAIISYLRGLGYEDPRLTKGTFLHIVDSLDQPRLREARKGDAVTFYYEARYFSNGPGIPFYINKKSLLDSMKNNYGLTANWSTDPYRIVLGNSSVMKSIQRNLYGRKEGDHLHIFMTSEAAYGDKMLASVPEETPIVFVINIESVTGK